MDTNIDIPGYKIIEPLGQGGMAQVYLAIQESIGRQVALKVMSEALSHDKVWAKRFLQEAQVIAQLSHPNIVPVFDVGEHKGKFFISMEHISGGNLKEKMQSGLAVTSSLKIVTGIAAGLDFAGEKGFVHRDIKPDNIMFREDGSPVILDFGIVKQKNTDGSNMTQTGMIVGTTAYMSPEQAQAQTLDERSDIYSLGVVFYEMITGIPPFKGDSDIATLLSHVNEDPAPLPDFLSALQPIIDKSLAKNKQHRYKRGKEMIEHIESLEKPIKAMLVDLEKLRSNKSESDATIIISQTSGNKNSTQIRTPAPTSKTEDDDLTLVLNSAKATIKDHSAETRAKKAKRTRNLVLAASVASLIAIGYLGYHQILILPEEKKLAEERIKASELKIQNKISSLLIKANRQRSSIDFKQSRDIDSLIAVYFEILKLEPDNTRVKLALDDLAEQFFSMANKAVLEKEIEGAELYQNYLIQVAPSHASIESIRNSIKSLRANDIQEQIDNQLKGQKIETLLELAQKDMELHEGFSVSAYTQLKQVLRLDPKNDDAQSLVIQMQQSLETNIENNIKKRAYSKAKQQLEQLESYYQNSEKKAKLKKSLASANSKAKKEKQVSSLVAKVSQLKREKRTILVNDELRSLYNGILSLNRQSSMAKNGLKEASLYDLDIANKSIIERDFVRAKEQIRVVKESTPKLPELQLTQRKLDNALLSAKKSDQMLSNSEKIIGGLTEKNKPGQLRKALDSVLEAQSIDPKNPRLIDTISLLETTYINEISLALSNKDKKLSKQYFSDTKEITWPSNRIMELQLADQNSKKDKNKPKRNFVGGF